MHEVEIPGGVTLVEFGTYEVPIWTTSIEYPPGTRVTDVILASRGEPTAYDDLNLAVVDTFTSTMTLSNQSVPASVAGWYPTLDQIYDWSIEELNDGGSLLEIVVYPFYYNSDNGDAIYYKKHNFQVETTTSSVHIHDLAVEKQVWDMGDWVWANLVVENSGVMTDVIVQASIRDRATGDLVAGLPLISLDDLTGVGSIDLYWDSTKTPWGQYDLMVELRNSEGQVLDTVLDDFQLGVVLGGVSILEASQVEYYGGESIELSVTVVNSGTVSLDGLAVIEVQGSDWLTTTRRITGTFEALAPGESLQFSGFLETSVTDSSYAVVARMSAYSQVSEAAHLTLNRKPRVFLPLVGRD
jgi:hypothetical protein